MSPQFGFEQLLAPFDAAVFFAEYYERRPLRVARNDPSFYDRALTLDKIDNYLTSGAAHYPGVLMVQHETDVPTSDFADSEGRIDPARLHRRFTDGATIVVNHLERHLPDLAALCRASERHFGMPFQTNIYLSPPSAQGFRTHYDTHDVFVLQIAGRKLWTIYDNHIALPLPGQGFDRERHHPGAPTDQFVLEAGDLLYCPRGVMHDARTADDLSLHVTFGLLGKTWADLLLESVATICLADPAWRRHLPTDAASPAFDRSAFRTTFAGLVDTIASQIDVDAVLDSMIAGFITSRPPALQGQLAQQITLDALTPDAVVQPRPALIWRIDTAGDRITLLAPGREIDLPAYVRPEVEALLTSPAAIADLPGELDDDGRLVLVRRLITEGLLTHEAAP